VHAQVQKQVEIKSLHRYNNPMHSYRTHKCNELRKSDVGQQVRLSGWIHRIRDHGGVLFIDLRDTYGLTQCVVDQDSPLLEAAGKWRNESVITVTGKVKARTPETVNAKMPTGEIELYIDEAALQSPAAVVPFQIAEDDGAGEDIRLRHRYLDLRREKMQRNIKLRNSVIFSLRKRMWESGLPGIPDAEPHRLIARRRARLSGAFAPASRQILRASAIAAAIQAAPDGRRFRPLFPGRALLPR
jgi:lysyl-tRNA synthetase class II